MSLSRGLWSDLSVVIYPVAAILLFVVAMAALRGRSSHRLAPRHALVLPLGVGLGEVLLLGVTRQEAWFWLFVGTAVAVGAAGALGTAVRGRQRESATTALAFLGCGVLGAHLLSPIPLRWTLALAGSVGVVAFAIGYLAPSVGRRPPERSTFAT